MADHAPSAAPLAGRAIIVTRPEPGGALVEALEALGATVHDVPATRFEPLPAAEVRAGLAVLEDADWVVLTSRHAVAELLAHVEAMGLDRTVLARLGRAVVGAATAEALMAVGLPPTVVPERFVAEGVLEALAARTDVPGRRIVYATADGARDVLPDGLRALGAQVTVVPMYRSVPDPEAPVALRGAVDAGAALVTLTAPSTAEAWAAAIGPEVAARVPAASIGPVTTKAARALGIPVVVEAAPSTASGLAEAIGRYFSRS